MENGAVFFVLVALVWGNVILLDVRSRLLDAHVQSCPEYDDPACAPLAFVQTSIVNVTLKVLSSVFASCDRQARPWSRYNIMMIHGYPFGSEYFIPVAMNAMKRLREAGRNP